MISVILPTYRPGGLDVVCDSLARQTYKDFELIIADGIVQYRAAAGKWRDEAARPLYQGFPEYRIRHISTHGRMLTDYCSSLNDAVAIARGEVILLIPDYSWLMDDCLETHARFHAEHKGEKVCAMAEYSTTEMPPVHPSFPGYHPSKRGADAGQLLTDPGARFEAAMNAEADRYEEDLNAGRLDAVMWSLWAEPLTYEAMLELPVKHHHQLWDTYNPDGTTGVSVEWGPNHCSLKNESFPIELFEELNGLDEDLDGSHLYQDREFSLRLTQAGWQWHRLRGGTLRIIDPRPVATMKRCLRPMRSNGAIADAVEAGVKKQVNPGWSMKMRRHHV